MPHFLNFDQMRESVFILQHLCLGSTGFCSIHQVRRLDSEENEGGWEYYAGMMKSLVSEAMIQNAIRTRIIQDTLAEEKDEEEEMFDVSGTSDKAIKGFDVARNLADSKSLSLRELSNKILHATDTRLVWSEEEGSKPTSWTGVVHLFGQQGCVDWKVELNAEKYAHVLARWLDMLDAEVDWHYVYKHDE